MASKSSSRYFLAEYIGFPWPHFWDCLTDLYAPKYLLNMKTTSVLGFALSASAERTALSNILHPVNCCQSLVDAGFQNVYMPNNTSYSERVESYWSLTSQLTPECFVQPRDTDEVAAVLEVLLRETQCPFAVRSGGHSSTAGANNIEKAVTIDLGLLNKTTYDPDNSIASVEPGARWLSVYRTLDEYNVGVLGGRIGTVGVGGLLLGGGCSLYLFRQGFATDNIAAMEVVLANSTIVTTSAQENSDLFTALKGGGNNFGIVTRFDLMAFPASPIWSGSTTHPEGVDPSAHISALKHWVDNVETYQNSSAVVFWAYRPQLKETIIIKGLVDVGGRPSPPIFDEFLSIPGNTSGSSVVTNMSTVALGTQAEGYRNIWFSVTFKNDERILTRAVELHHRLVEEMKADSSDGDFETQCFFQPLPSIIGKHGAERGGNLLGIDRHEDNAVILLGSLAVNGQMQEAIGREKMMTWKRDLEDYSRSLDAQVEYYYMNYADGTQDVLSSYGEDRVRMALDVAAKYDPTGVFQNRVVGGFKLPNAATQV